MIRTIIWFIYFWISLLIIMPQLNKVKKLDRQGKIKERDEIVFKTTKNWASKLIRLSGTKVNVSGRENIPVDTAVVFIGNHQGNFDVPIYIACLDKPKGFISKVEIRKMPIINTWMEYMQCVFIQRGNPRKAIEAINQGVEKIKNGYSMVIFPEGTRSKSDAVGEFKPGSFKLALKSGAPIVPVTVKGTYNIMEKHKFIITPSDVELIISPPIYTSNLSREEINELPEKVKAIIQNNLCKTADE